MTLTAIPSSTFGGLRLLDQAGELDSDVALDLADVRAEEAGGVRNRPGSERFSASADSPGYDSLFWSRAGTDCLLAGRGDRLRAITAAGVLDDLTAALAAPGPYSFAAFGAPGTERVYAAQGEDLVYWDGSSFTVNPTVTVDGVAAQPCPRGSVLAVTPWDNRLMVMGFTGATDGPDGAATSPSTIYLSEQGDPGTWVTTHRVHLTPGDGEAIVAAVVWRDRVFVFKQTKFFVFTGTSDAGGGNPFFDNYAVEAGNGAHAVQGVCRHRDGVYFVDRQGVFRTQGEEPELVSWELDPLFYGRDAPFFTGDAMDRSALDEISLCSANELVHVSYTAESGERRVLVYDPRISWWGYDRMDAAAMVAVPQGAQDELFFAGSDDYVHRHGEGLVDDEASEVRGHWRGGWQSFGDPGTKVVRMAQVWGSGIVAGSYGVDFGSLAGAGDVDLRGNVDEWGDGSGPDEWGDGSDPTDVWGTGGGYEDGWFRYAVQGDYVSFQVLAKTAVWSIQRVDQYVLVVRPTADIAGEGE